MTKTYREQDGPFCIQMEFTEGCNLGCTFCGLQGIRAPKVPDFKFMKETTLRAALRGAVTAGWNPRIEFAMRGEPSMHPDFVNMVRAAREEAPDYQIMMTSNGGGFLRKPGALANVKALFEAGLNVLALDDYKGIGLVPKIRAAVMAQTIKYVPSNAAEHVTAPEYEAMTGELLSPFLSMQDGRNAVEILEYPLDPRGNPHRRHRISYRMLSFVQDVEEAIKGTHAVLTNHAGNGAPPLAEPLREQCAKPFREMGVRWDGSIAGCCNDWRGVYKCGNVNDTVIDKVWNGPAFGAMRELLYDGRRDQIKPCDVCDYHTYRNGLLPDKMGKETLPKPDGLTLRDAQTAMSGEQYTRSHTTKWGH